MELNLERLPGVLLLKFNVQYVRAPEVGPHLVEVASRLHVKIPIVI